MNRQEKERLHAGLAALHAGERQKLHKRAAKLRKQAMRGGARTPSQEEVLLRMLDEMQATASPATAAGEATGEVIGVAKGRVTIGTGDAEVEMPLCAGLAQVQASAVAVGDQVQWAGDPPCVTAVLPRRTRLSRPDPGAPQVERVLAANVDTVVLVMSVQAPPLRPRLIDRALLAVEHGGASPLIAVTKVDLLPPDERESQLALLHPYRSQGIPVIACSTVTGEGLPALRQAVAGQTCVLVGHSGVGKSSLLNALDPTLSLRTNGLRKGDGKGRHTTTASRLYRLPDGTRLIDTPGVRAFGLWRMSGAEIRAYFPEFAGVAAGCAFTDCRHTHEPDCAVKQAVGQGRIARARYAAYRRLLGEEEQADVEGGPVMAAFACAHCGEPVIPEGAGSAHRNHCPRCLWSVHLDDRPGDRAAGCSGHMEPIAVWIRKGGEWALIHRCRACGVLRSNRIAADDNELLLMSLAVRPLAKPPFQLESVTP